LRRFELSATESRAFPFDAIQQIAADAPSSVRMLGVARRIS